MKKVSPGDKVATSRRWVDPSFSELPEESVSLEGSRRRKVGQVLSSKTEAKTQKRKRETDSPHTHTTNQPKEFIHKEWDEAWVDRHFPSSKAELAVHKKKVEEVENWMRVYASTSKQGGILLLTGPSGCGKTTTVQVLSREQGLRIQEWTNPTCQESYISSQQECMMKSVLSTSQLTQFQEFILRANKYSCLKLVGDKESAEEKLILVEDFPNQIYRQPSRLHDILRCFVKTSRCPLVFILSDSGDCSSRSLFPREVLEEVAISSISFNPVAPTTMMKVLNRISTLESGKSGGRICIPDQAVLEMLCSGSSGDIRSAINSLQFYSLPGTSLYKGMLRKDQQMTLHSKASFSSSLRKKKFKQTKETEEEQAIGGKDACLFLFRALGKILHCKRGNPEGSLNYSSSALPPDLSHHHREALLVDPELVVERSNVSGEFFNLYLHQNYLDFFSEMEDVDIASEYLSDADILTADWTNRSIMRDYGSSVATRGLLYSNSQQVAVGFRPLHKPSWLLVKKKYQANCLAAQNLFRSSCLPPVNLQTELLPYLAKLTNPLRNQAQIAFIQDVGHMSQKRVPGRLKLEALTEKEQGQVVVDSDEDEKDNQEDLEGSEEGLPASQSQPTATQILMQEQDMLIEEYDSD